ncbi:unnamed protein product [Caenorhabditis angaria]|uniref:GOLD domain-containing protein n=1 Tax=Caenorhabditis angaria TaxID=860376 RepID=A0A9P1N2T8_9PELO|nr:unnamed protein product [Caenorhabditis angaria]
MRSLIFLLGVILTQVFCALSDHGTNIQVPFNSLETQCYWFQVEKYSSQIDLEVEDDNPNGNLDVELRNVDGEILVEEKRTWSQHIQWPVKNAEYLSQIGFYQVCIKNLESQQTQIQLIINTHDKSLKTNLPHSLIRKINRDKKWNTLETLISFERFDEITIRMLNLLEESQATLAKYSFRLHSQMGKVDEIAKLVTICGSFISACVVLVGFLQAWSIRQLFNDSSKYGHLLRNGRRGFNHHIY